MQIHDQKGAVVDSCALITGNRSLIIRVVPALPTQTLEPQCDLEHVNPLLKVKCQGFLTLQGPRVTAVEQASSLRAQTMLGTERSTVLTNQGLVWGDDEIVWHLSQIQQKWNQEKVWVT